MHQEVKEFLTEVKRLYPSYFREARVVEFGSVNINGSARDYFEVPDVYTGVDLCEGPGVNVVSLAHEFWPPDTPNVVVSTEMLEHDKHWILSLNHMWDILRRNGLLIITCASSGRPEHGTARTTPTDSPMTQDYYRNLTEGDFRYAWGSVEEKFLEFSFTYNPHPGDLYFWGIKA